MSDVGYMAHRQKMLHTPNLGELTNYANRWRLYHRSSYALSQQLVYIVLLFAVTYKIMTVWLNTTI